jgi:hypothetical protein
VSRAAAAVRQGGNLVQPAVLAVAIGVLALSVTTGTHIRSLTAVTFVAVLLAAGSRRLVAWRNPLALLVVVIFFLPIRRYILPGHLPFQIEPYRILVALLAGAWIAGLLVDRRVRIRASGFEGPMLAVVLAAFGSVSVNGNRIADMGVQTEVAKALTFFVSFVIVFYLIVSVIRSLADVDFLVKAMVVSGAVLAVFAAIEASTGYNIFNHLSQLLPILGHPDIPYTLLHPTGRLRVYASAENPIALAAVFVMLVPLSAYLALSSGRKRWWLASFLLLMGAVASISRTAMVMLVVIVLVLLRLRPTNVRRLWIGIVPLLLGLHFAVPGALGGLTERFSPRGGLIAQQSQGTGSTGSGRLAHLGPGFHEFARHPILGEGFGSRVTTGPTANASILDDQWLGTLLETGAFGVLAWIWFFGRYARRLVRLARQDQGPPGTLAAALASSVLALAVAWFVFDCLSFAQITFLLFIFLALGSALLSAVGQSETQPSLRERAESLARRPAWAGRAARP